MATAPVKVETQENEQITGTNEENFSAAFDQLAKLGEGDEYKPVAAAPVTPEKTPEQLAAEVEAKSVGATTDGDAEIDATDAEERPVAPTHKEDGTPFTAEEIAAEQTRLDKEADDAKAAADAETAAARQQEQEERAVDRLAETLNKRLQPQQPTTTQQTTQQSQPELYTAEEKAQLAEYDKEWGDVAKGEMLRRRGEYHHLTNYIFAEVTRNLQPIADMVAALAERTHSTDLTTRIPDYDTARDKVIEWVDKQPDYLKAAYTQVVQQGTAEQVADLIERWRKDTGATIAPRGQQAAPVVPKKEPSAAAQAVAAKLAPTPSKRTTPVAGVAKEDFDGAFAEANKALADL